MALLEKDFEGAIEAWLCSPDGGWQKGTSVMYDAERALIPQDLLDFVQKSQPQAWRRYVAAVGARPEQKFLDTFCRVLARRETSILDVLRHGLETRGVRFQLVGWRPETGLNADTQALYEVNILRCVRQLYYSAHNENSVDMALFVNGIPLVMLELKNQFTGQSVADSRRQYCDDRSPQELVFRFRKRTLVYFAVDLYEAWMTTRLAGRDTYFMPFNQGSNGAGQVGGAGNPANPDGFVTAYLWQQVLQRDSLLEIFHKYMLYDAARDRMVFPRYHQLDVVTKLLEAYARQTEQDEAALRDADDPLLDELAAHGQQPNLSFFAFTATPKNRTLQIFGQQDDSGAYVPFHIYSMRQAIEEHYILDVLQNYVTYSMYYKIIKDTPENPELDNAQAVASIKRFETLHPHNIAQKTEIIMEHFLRITRHKIGGRAKAMIVTASRLHAVRYLFAIRSYIEQHHLADDVGVLVAFSGEVEDGGERYTEPQLNVQADGEHISEKALPEAFHGDDFNVLVVAEKYQTGFDEPLLHTMFVDKKLSGVKAVQTLSRLNRTCKGKSDTFVLDFVNTAEEIQAAFEPFYDGTTLAEGTDPDIIYSMRAQLDNFGLYGREDVQAVATLFYRSGGEGEAMGQISSLLKPTLDRYLAKPLEQQREFRQLLRHFNRIYAFITQIARMFDRDMQGYSVFASLLASVLPHEQHETVDVERLLGLEYYKLKKDFDGSITLNADGVLQPITGGNGATRQPEKKPLAAIIEQINEKYQTNFTGEDRVLQQIADDFQRDPKAVNFAKHNDERMFYQSYYQSKFTDIILDRFQQNDEFVKFVTGSEEVMRSIMEGMLHEVYEGLRRQ